MAERRGAILMRPPRQARSPRKPTEVKSAAVSPERPAITGRKTAMDVARAPPQRERIPVGMTVRDQPKPEAFHRAAENRAAFHFRSYYRFAHLNRQASAWAVTFSERLDRANLGSSLQSCRRSEDVRTLARASRRTMSRVFAKRKLCRNTRQ